MQYCKCRKIPHSHWVVSLHARVSQSSELIWRKTIRESVIAAKGSVIHHLQNKGSQHWKMHELFRVFETLEQWLTAARIQDLSFSQVSSRWLRPKLFLQRDSASFLYPLHNSIVFSAFFTDTHLEHFNIKVSILGDDICGCLKSLCREHTGLGSPSSDLVMPSSSLIPEAFKANPVKPSQQAHLGPYLLEWAPRGQM